MRKTIINLSISVCVHCTVLEAEEQGRVLGWEHNCVRRASLYRNVYTSLIGGVHCTVHHSCPASQVKRRPSATGLLLRTQGWAKLVSNLTFSKRKAMVFSKN